MKTIYYVYQLNEKRNKHGNPYVGMTENLKNRAAKWKSELELDYTPELIVLHTDTNGQRTFDWEQDKRVEWKWPRERSYRHQKKMRKKGSEASSKSEKVKENAKKIGSIQGKINAKKNVESGHWDSISHLGRKAASKAKAVITKEEAEQIIKEYIPGKKGYSTLALAKKYGFDKNLIWKVVNGKQNNYKD